MEMESETRSRSIKDTAVCVGENEDCPIVCVFPLPVLSSLHPLSSTSSLSSFSFLFLSLLSPFFSPLSIAHLYVESVIELSDHGLEGGMSRLLSDKLLLRLLPLSRACIVSVKQSVGATTHIYYSTFRLQNWECWAF